MTDIQWREVSPQEYVGEAGGCEDVSIKYWPEVRAWSVFVTGARERSSHKADSLEEAKQRAVVLLRYMREREARLNDALMGVGLPKARRKR
jgi:hypothetical protein